MIDLTIVVEHSPDGFISRNQLKWLLRDFYPKETRDINVALILYDSGIVNKISAMRKIESKHKKIFIKHLFDDFGLNEELAVMGIEMWANAYKIPVDNTYDQPSYPIPYNYNTVQGYPQQQNSPVYNKPYNNVNVYQYQQPPVQYYPQQAAPPQYMTAQYLPGRSQQINYTQLHTNTAQPPVQRTLAVYRNIAHKVGNNVFVYDVAEKNNGYIIIKFNGIAAKEMVVPNLINDFNIIGIGKNVFRNHTEIEHLKLSIGIEFIDDGAFYECTNLKTVEFPATLRQIGSNKKNKGLISNERAGAFEKCSSLTEVVLPKSLKSINDSSFCSCEKLKTVVLSEGLQYIRDFAFYGCRKLTDINFPITLDRVGYWAFHWCNSLKEVYLNEGLHRIGEGAFGYCDKMTKFFIPSTVTQIDKDILSGCNMKKLTVYCFPDTPGRDYAILYGLKNESALKLKYKTGGKFQ